MKHFLKESESLVKERTTKMGKYNEATGNFHQI